MPVVNADLSWAIEDVRARQPSLALFKNYDEGNHRLLFATEKFLNTFGSMFREFSDNLCDDVVDAITDRLQITGWSVTGNDKSLATTMTEVWELNQGESRTGAIMRNGFRDGDGFAIVQVGKDQHARFFRQDPRCMAIRYSTDAPDEIELAAKVWKAGKRYRANLYYEDRTEKWASRGVGANNGMPQASQFRLLPAGDPDLKGDDTATLERDGDLPVYHFPNGELSGYGRSILTGVIPLQDALNKAICDMLVTMEATAAPLRWATGVQVELDPVTGVEKDPFKKQAQTPGSVLRVGSKEARLGQFDASEMTGFLDVQDSFKIEAARKGAMPPYAITLRNQSGQAPSGISLLVAEGRTVKLALDRQRDWGTEKRRMMAHLLNLELGTNTVTAKDVDPNWAPPQTRDMQALLEELTLKQGLGVPDSQLLLEAGYDPEQVQKFMDDAVARQADMDAAMRAAAGGATRTVGQTRTLNEGLGLPGGPRPPVGGATALAQE